MIQVFTGETGGEISFSYDSTISASSGIVTLYGRRKQIYVLSGTLSSGLLFISKANVNQLPPGDYVVFAKIIDTNSLVYYLAPEDIEVVYIPPGG